VSETAGEPLEGGADARKHLRGSSILLAGRLVAMVISMITQVVLVRNLAKADYGAFAYGLSIADAFVFVVGLGQSQALNRFLTLYDERGQTGRFRGAILLACGTALAAGGALAAAAWASRTVLEDTLVDDPTAVSVLLVFLLLTPLGALDRIGVAVLAVMARARDIAFRKHLMVPVLRLAAAATLVPLGASVVRLAQAYVVIGVLGILTYVVLIAKRLRRSGRWERFWSGPLDLPFREVYGFALPLLTTELLVLSINAGSSVVLGLVQGTEEVARYRAVFPAARLNQLAIFTFTTLFIPLAARHFARNDDAGMRDSYRTTALWLGILGLPIFLLTGPFAASTTGLLFGSQYDDAAPVMAILSGGYYLSTVLGFNAHTLQAYGRLRPLVAANAIAFVLNLGLTVTLGARFGAVGVAVSNGLALAVHNGINQWSLRRLLGPTLSSRASRTVLTAIGASIVLSALVATTGPHVLVAAAVTAAASLATLRVSRSHLAVLETFPEAARIPGMKSLLR
jgi:O-antigen/teichoic acid export membrane protein